MKRNNPIEKQDKLKKKPGIFYVFDIYLGKTESFTISKNKIQ